MDFYIFLQLLIVSITATSSMKLFSYLVSGKFKEWHKNPFLPTSEPNKIKLSTNSRINFSWLIHYLIGFLFVVGYHLVWLNNILTISFLSAFILGVISGIIAILFWMFVLQISSIQPPINFKEYCMELIIAYIVFAIVATTVYSFSLVFLILAKT